MIVMIDNYDSFTYNLYQYLMMLGARVQVVRNDRITVQEVQKLDPEAIVISPGPGRPEDAGISVALIEAFSGKIPVLGVCLGHQAIAIAFGGQLKNLKNVLHGVSRPTYIIDSSGIYKGIGDTLMCGRYHSWVVDKDIFPENLLITAYDEHNEIMSMRHRLYDVTGVQYHPESILTENGKVLLKNWLNS